MVAENEMVYLFKFQPFNMPKSINLSYQVYSSNPDLMSAFLKQHKFDNCEQYVTFVNSSDLDLDIDGIEELGVFKIGSNKLHKVCNIVTSGFFIEKCSLNVCSKLSQASLFGDIITKNIRLAKEVTERVNSLPHGMVLDIGTDEYESLNVKCRDPRSQLYSTLEEWAERLGPDDLFSDPDSPDDIYIYDSICEETVMATTYNQVLPFTLEAYTEFMVSILTDEYR